MVSECPVLLLEMNQNLSLLSISLAVERMKTIN